MAYSTKNIDGFEIKVRKQKLRKRIRLQAKVARIAGGAIARAVGSLTSGMDIQQLKTFGIGNVEMQKLISPFIAGLTENLSADELDDAIDALLVGVFVDDADIGQEEIFDKFFEEDEALMWKVIAFSAEVNLSDFLSKMLTSKTGSPAEEIAQSEADTSQTSSPTN